MGAPVPHSVGELGPHLTQCGMGRGLSPYQVASWSIQPFGHNTSTLQNRQADRQTDNGPIAQGEPFYKRSPKNWISWFQKMSALTISLRKLCRNSNHFTKLAPYRGRKTAGMKRLCHCHPMHKWRNKIFNSSVARSRYDSWTSGSFILTVGATD